MYKKIKRLLKEFFTKKVSMKYINDNKSYHAYNDPLKDKWVFYYVNDKFVKVKSCDVIKDRYITLMNAWNEVQKIDSERKKRRDKEA